MDEIIRITTQLEELLAIKTQMMNDLKLKKFDVDVAPLRLKRETLIGQIVQNVLMLAIISWDEIHEMNKHLR